MMKRQIKHKLIIFFNCFLYFFNNPSPVRPIILVVLNAPTKPRAHYHFLENMMALKRAGGLK